MNCSATRWRGGAEGLVGDLDERGLLVRRPQHAVELRLLAALRQHMIAASPAAAKQFGHGMSLLGSVPVLLAPQRPISHDFFPRRPVG